MTYLPRRRIVIFTANPDLLSSPWWPLIARREQVERILLVRCMPVPGLAALLKRLRQNVRKHGLVFIPYRIGTLVIGAAQRAHAHLRHGRREGAAHAAVPVETIAATDIHSPEVRSRVRDFTPDLGLSIGAPVLRASLFGIPPMGTLNLHLGKVPDFRGAPPGFWELMRGADHVGVTIHWVDEGLDTGAVVASDVAPVYATDRLVDVEARLEELGRILLVEALARVFDGTAVSRPQPAGGTTNRMPTLRARARLLRRALFGRFARTLGRPVWLAKSAAAAIALFLVRPVRDAWRTLAGTHPVRIFTYHRVTELCRDGMTISPREFARQVAYIVRTHDVVPMDRALDHLAMRTRLRRPLAVLSFDDAYASVAEHAAPVLRQYDVPACIFVSTALAGTDRRFAHDDGNPVRAHLSCMTWEQLDCLRNEGWALGAHTANHVRLSECTGERLRAELREPLAALGSRVGPSGAILAFPFGKATDMSAAARDEARAAGYRACLSNHGGENHPSTAEPFDLHRIDLGADHEPLAWKALARGFQLTRFRGYFGARNS